MNQRTFIYFSSIFFESNLYIFCKFLISRIESSGHDKSNEGNIVICEPSHRLWVKKCEKSVKKKIGSELLSLT